MHPDHSPLTKALSDQLLRHASVGVWRKVFLHGDAGLRFERRVQTLLHANALSRGWELEELAQLAGRFDGRAEPCARGEALLSFDHPLNALRAALLLQKVGADTGVTSGLATGECTVAHFLLDGRACRMTLPPEAARAEARARHAPPGTIVMGADTYDLLEPFMADEVQDGLVAIESDGERVAHVSITLAPHANAALSTFAGIGMD